MAEEKLKTDWDRTAELAALIYNVNKKKDAPEIKAAEINPYRKTKPRRIRSMDALDQQMANAK